MTVTKTTHLLQKYFDEPFAAVTMGLSSTHRCLRQPNPNYSLAREERRLAVQHCPVEVHDELRPKNMKQKHENEVNVPTMTVVQILIKSVPHPTYQ